MKPAILALFSVFSLLHAPAYDSVTRANITYDIQRDRRVIVSESFEVINEEGTLDRGLDRLFWTVGRDPSEPNRHSGWRLISFSSDANVTPLVHNNGDQVTLHIPIPRGSHSYSYVYELNRWFRSHELMEEVILPSFQSQVSIAELTSTVKYPVEIQDHELNASVWTEGDHYSSSNGCQCTLSRSPGSRVYTTSRALEAGESIHFDIGFPIGHFNATYASEGLLFPFFDHPAVAAWAIFCLTLCSVCLVLAGIWRITLRWERKYAVTATCTALLNISLVAALLLHSPYPVMPGFMVGIFLSMAFFGGAHGPKSPVAAIVIGVLTNIFCYYLTSFIVFKFLDRLRQAKTFFTRKWIE